MTNPHMPQNSNTKDTESSSRNNRHGDSNLDTSRASTSDAPKLESLTADKLLLLLGPTAQMKFEGACRICLEGSQQASLDQPGLQGRCVIDLQFPADQQVQVPNARLILTGRNEVEARRMIDSLMQTEIAYEPTYYWFSEEERQNLVAMLPSLKAASLK